MSKIPMPLIGGHHDGERVEFDPDETYLYLPYFPEEGEVSKWEAEGFPRMRKYSMEGYKIHQIKAGSQVFYYLAEKHLSGEEAVERLIQGYKGKIYDPVL